jgi:hypothetical protein
MNLHSHERFGSFIYLFRYIQEREFRVFSRTLSQNPLRYLAHNLSSLELSDFLSETAEQRDRQR